MISILFLLFLAPGIILASLEHLSYRIKRVPSPDDDFGGSGREPLAGPTHEDDEPDIPENGGGGDPALQETPTNNESKPTETETDSEIPAPPPLPLEKKDEESGIAEKTEPPENPVTPQTPLEDQATSQITQVQVPVTPVELPVTPLEPHGLPKEAPALEESPVTTQELPATPQDASVTPQEAPATPEEFPATPEESPATPEEFPATPEESPATPEEFPTTPQGVPVIPKEPLVPPQEPPVRTIEDPVPPQEVPVPPLEAPVTPHAVPTTPGESPVSPQQAPTTAHDPLIPPILQETLPTSETAERVVEVATTVAPAHNSSSTASPDANADSSEKPPLNPPSPPAVLPPPPRISGVKIPIPPPVKEGDASDFSFEDGRSDEVDPSTNKSVILPEDILTPKYNKSIPKADTTSTDLRSPDDDSWTSFLPGDEISLLIFIILCLILIVILLVCCFLLQQMKSWVVIRTGVVRSGHNTYANVCPLRTTIEDEVTKCSVEPEPKRGLELVSFSMPPKAPRRPEVHRSTAEVVLTADADPKLGVLTPPITTTRPTSDPWIREVLKSIEAQEAEPEPTLEVRPIPTFLQKYSMTNTSSKVTNSQRLTVPQLENRAGSVPSVDDISGDELDDYLDNSNFPV